MNEAEVVRERLRSQPCARGLDGEGVSLERDGHRREMPIEKKLDPQRVLARAGDHFVDQRHILEIGPRDRQPHVDRASRIISLSARRTASAALSGSPVLCESVDCILATGAMVERIVGRRLRSETIKSGCIPKAATGL